MKCFITFSFIPKYFNAAFWFSFWCFYCSDEHIPMWVFWISWEFTSQVSCWYGWRKIPDMISVFSSYKQNCANVLPNVWSVLENSLCILKKNMHSSVDRCDILWVSFSSIWIKMNSKASIYFIYFYLFFVCLFFNYY